MSDVPTTEDLIFFKILREQADRQDGPVTGWAALNHASVMVERGLHRPVRA